MHRIPSKKINKLLIYTNIFVACVYMSWWFLPKNVGTPYLYQALLVGEIYHVLMSFIFWFNIYPGKKTIAPDYTRSFTPSIDIYITVAGEPLDVVKKTIEAVQAIDYTNFRVYVLNDGYVAKKENWKEIENLSGDMGVKCITRKIPGGAKAGNINYAMSQTKGEFISIFDADMKPYKKFIKRLIPYFKNSKVGFVQSPQYYANRKNNDVVAGSWEQQELFFGAILKGKDRDNAAFICGTNFIARRAALTSVGGFTTDSIAEDVLTSVLIHQKGWISHYTDEILSEGIGPEDLLSYYKQQRRWAFGSLSLLFDHNPLFKKGLTFKQKVHYLASVLFYINGIIVAIDILMPLIYFYFGLKPVAASTASFAIFFIPYIFLILYTLFESSGKSITFHALAFSQSAWFLQIQVFVEYIMRRKVSFDITPKKAQAGNFISLAIPHMLYIGLGLIGIVVVVLREGINTSIITNIAWFIFNAFMFISFIKAAYPWKNLLGTPTTKQTKVTYQLK